MQEISPHIFIETGYPGVTLGAIYWPHGLILIDAPFRPDDIRAWRSTLLNMSGGVDRMLINLDAHYDRTLGSRLVECTVTGQEKMVQIFRDRPTTFKAQAPENGSEYELYNGLGSVRWAPPEITFSDRMVVHYDGTPLVLEHHPGPAPEAIWVAVPEEKIVFVGDTVVPNAPPFLANANIAEWKSVLELLLSEEYRNFTIISGRDGIVMQDQIAKQYKFLETVEAQITRLAEAKAPLEETEKLIPMFLRQFDIPAGRLDHFTMRLKYGLAHYYAQHNKTVSAAEA